MSKSNTFENEFLNHILTNAAIPNIGDGPGLPAAATAGDLFMRLFTTATTCDDANLGTEAAYTGYGVVSIARAGAQWTISNNQAQNTNAITFGQNTGGSETIRYWGLFRTNGAATEALRVFWGQFTSDLVVGTNITPEISALGITITED